MELDVQKTFVDLEHDATISSDQLSDFQYVSKGGFALVYGANFRHNEGVQPVAVKVLKPENHFRPASYSKFLQELAFQAALPHPFIVRALGFCSIPVGLLIAATPPGLLVPGESTNERNSKKSNARAQAQDWFARRRLQKCWALVLELMTDGNLYDQILAAARGGAGGAGRRTPWGAQQLGLAGGGGGGAGSYSDAQGLLWLIDVADAMTFVHSRQPVLIHRDLKPENILLRRGADGLVRAKLADFGLTVAVDSSGVKVAPPQVLRAPGQSLEDVCAFVQAPPQPTERPSKGARLPPARSPATAVAASDAAPSPSPPPRQLHSPSPGPGYDQHAVPALNHHNHQLPAPTFSHRKAQSSSQLAVKTNDFTAPALGHVPAAGTAQPGALAIEGPRLAASPVRRPRSAAQALQLRGGAGAGPVAGEPPGGGAAAGAVQPAVGTRGWVANPAAAATAAGAVRAAQADDVLPTVVPLRPPRPSLSVSWSGMWHRAGGGGAPELLGVGGTAAPAVLGPHGLQPTVSVCCLAGWGQALGAGQAGSQASSSRISETGHLQVKMEQLNGLLRLGMGHRDYLPDMYQITFRLTSQCGSVCYMAPEVARQLPYNQKADVFSFGCLMYEVLTRQLLSDTIPEGDLEAAMEYLGRVSWSGWRPDLPSWLPKELRLLISLCWHREPRLRPSFPTIATRLREVLLAAAMPARHTASSVLSPPPPPPTPSPLPHPTSLANAQQQLRELQQQQLWLQQQPQQQQSKEQQLQQLQLQLQWHQAQLQARLQGLPHRLHQSASQQQLGGGYGAAAVTAAQMLNGLCATSRAAVVQGGFGSTLQPGVLMGNGASAAAAAAAAEAVSLREANAAGLTGVPGAGVGTAAAAAVELNRMVAQQPPPQQQQQHEQQLQLQLELQLLNACTRSVGGAGGAGGGGGGGGSSNPPSPYTVGSRLPSQVESSSTALAYSTVVTGCRMSSPVLGALGGHAAGPRGAASASRDASGTPPSGRATAAAILTCTQASDGGYFSALSSPVSPTGERGRTRRLSGAPTQPGPVASGPAPERVSRTVIAKSEGSGGAMSGASSFRTPRSQSQPLELGGTPGAGQRHEGCMSLCVVM